MVSWFQRRSTKLPPIPFRGLKFEIMLSLPFTNFWSFDPDISQSILVSTPRIWNSDAGLGPAPFGVSVCPCGKTPTYPKGEGHAATICGSWHSITRRPLIWQLGDTNLKIWNVSGNSDWMVWILTITKRNMTLIWHPKTYPNLWPIRTGSQRSCKPWSWRSNRRQWWWWWWWWWLGLGRGRGSYPGGWSRNPWSTAGLDWW